MYEVTEEVYRSCDTAGGDGDGDGVRAKYTSGYDRVVLAEARGYWFICDVPGHCQGGMRVAVMSPLAQQQEEEEAADRR